MTGEENAGHIPLLHGALALIALRALATSGPQHAYELAARIEHSADGLFSVNAGTLYTTLVRLNGRGWIKATWTTTERGRRAKYFDITRAGMRSLLKQTEHWRHLTGVLNKLLVDE